MNANKHASTDSGLQRGVSAQSSHCCLNDVVVQSAQDFGEVLKATRQRLQPEKEGPASALACFMFASQGCGERLYGVPDREPAMLDAAFPGISVSGLEHLFIRMTSVELHSMQITSGGPGCCLMLRLSDGIDASLQDILKRMSETSTTCLQ